MFNRLIIYSILSLLFLIPTTSFSFILGDGNFSIPETDATNFQLFSFYDLRDRDSFVQVTNTGGQATLHVQVFDVSNLCNENNFFDSYTPNDSHIYNMSDITTNDGNSSGVVLPDGAYGFVVVTVVQGAGQPANQDGVIIGNFRVIDNAGYEYRSNSQGFMDGTPISGQYFINYSTVGDIKRSDVVGITVNNLLSGEVTAGGSSVTFDTNIINNNEVIFSCSDTTFSCTENTFEYGINNAIPHSRDKAVMCSGNNIPEGMVKLDVIDDSGTEAFAGFAGINTGDNSRGSMDSLIAVRENTCGDGILQTDEECDDGNTDDTDACNNECIVQGGCCLEDSIAMCVENLIPELDCTTISSSAIWLGDGTICDSTGDGNCSPMRGACCVEGVICQENLTETECENLGPTFYFGDGTLCSTVSCGIF